MTELDGLIKKYRFKADWHSDKPDSVVGIDRDKANEFNAIANYLEELKEYKDREDDRK